MTAQLKQKLPLVPVVLCGVALCMTVLLIAGSLAAEDAFDRADRNGDGRITPDEAAAGVPFQQIDADGDGVVTRAEAAAAVQKGILNRDGSPRNQRVAAVQSALRQPAADPGRSAEPVSASEHGVGRLVQDVAFTDLQGRRHQLSEFSDHPGVVIAMTSTSCPMSRKYLPTLTALSHEFGERGVQFVLVNCIASDEPESMREAAAGMHASAIYVVDEDETFLHHPGAVSTTDVFLLDNSRTVLFHGAVDDQYGIGFAHEQPRRSYLRDALQELLSGRRISVAATSAPGCLLEPDQPVTEIVDITWHNRISRIVRQNCEVCHRAGAVGPFPLTSFAEVSAHAAMVREVVSAQQMPPWFAAEVAEPHPGWKNDRSLSAANRRDLLAWLNGGRPEGDAADAIGKAVWTSNWELGEPDEVISIPEPVAVKASGQMPYVYRQVTWTAERDVWVQGYEVRPTDVSVVHHVIVEVFEPGSKRRMGGEGVGGYWAAWVPGNHGVMYPDGFARRLPAGATIQFQLHYSPNGKATTDQTQLGLHLAEQLPVNEVRTVSIAQTRLNIPAGAAGHVERLQRPVPFDMPVLGLMPHMHVRGAAFRYELDLLDGNEPQVLLDVPRYDFNWQLRYEPAREMVLPAGAQLILTAVYDNSSGNPANPDPGRNVRWGDQTTDEMMIGYIETWAPRGSVVQSVSETPVLNRILQALDQDGDGELTPAEMQAGNGQFAVFLGSRKLLEPLLERADRDNSGGLSRAELLWVREQMLQQRSQNRGN